jgi:hypothetical protein
MLKPIRVGAELFHNLVENNCYYVDKTPFIRTVFQDNQSDVMLITRPRRFGKTLTMSTFYDFLSLDPENPGDVSRQERWFKDTEIFNDKEFCSRYMGKFPVIFLTLKTVTHSNFQYAFNELAFIILSTAEKFKYLESSDRLDSYDKKHFRDLMNLELLKDMSDISILTNSLKTLTSLLNKHHGIKPILLIDEYDVPIAKAAHNNYYRDMTDVISTLFNSALKTNSDLGRAVLTGCLRAAKESIFTGLNNPLICSVLNLGNKDISAGIGFTKEETLDVLSYYGLSDYYDEVKNNYDGYNFGYVNMYCPWDVMSFCNENYLQVGDEGADITADNYWINTSGNDVIEEFMGYLKSDDTDKMQKLLDGESIITPVSASLCYGDLIKHNITDFWTLLLYTGYLTFDPKYRSETKGEYRLYIPNEEIRECFKSKIMDFFSSNQEMKSYTSDFVKGLFSGDGEKVENSLNELLAKYVSIRDFSTKTPKENYYHGFINGLLVNNSSLIQELKSNFESGDGYVDLTVKSAGICEKIAVLELKQTSDENVSRRKTASAAVEQIIRKRYADQYIENDNISEVLIYGICFCKKRCSVECKKLK